ncbi:unnamed protein product (macronuclear) [Paramecium tetraurelia]|uniref:Uncharacterized protein n=1 Tax=Paramecium tetraurelia TaxID=5888 RepID=A0CQ86_PARTE|nr:uncharacterized protein GSPATT00009301001 [Paramecium tetraurelia]CAK72953.1 unnamed protein product [Paramecium tetraurelia]|eukprot:XP_001440350.1 hypothetical protein (macronuclear) [Paramecium tetraurelia strain d4-2]
MNSIKMEINNPSTKIALIPMNKVIKKKKQNSKIKEQCLISIPQAKEFVTSFIIPRNINQNQYFRTKENIQFALTTFNDNTLGELGINIFSIGYSVSQTDIQQQKIEYHFQARDFDLADISTIFQMLRILNMDKAYNNLSKYLQRYDQISSIPCSTELEIQKVEELASKYPYECYTFRHERNESVILKYTHNIKFLQLMGITIDMIEEYLRETKTLPCAIRVNNYLEVWHQVFEAVSNDSQIFEMEVQNFNGKRFYVKIKQEQIFVEKDGKLYGYLYWIYLTDTNQNLATKNYEAQLDKLYPKPKECLYKKIK